MPTLRRVGSATLEEAAAAAYARALAAGAPDSVTSSYRDYNEQMYWFNGWEARLPGFNFALHPDKSDHCKGRAIDLRGSPAKAWFRAHGKAFGWLFTDAKEDWHIAYRPAFDQHRNDPVPEESDDMTPEQAQQLADTAQRVKNIEAAIGGIQTTIAAIKKVADAIKALADRLILSNTRMEKWFRVVAKTRGEEYPK